MDAGLTYDPPLEEGVFVRRYKRFFADVILTDGTEVVAHCPNTGSMLGIALPGAPCRVSRATNPKRRLGWTLEQVRVGEAWVMVHTGRPNRVVEQAVRAGRIPELAGYAHVLREQRFGERSRVDLLLLEGGDLPPGAHPVVRRGATRRPARHACYVEVKNVTLVREGVASFPDAVSTRGARHLDELAQVVREGHRGVLVLHVARADAHVFAPADDLDPAWGEALRRVVAGGVEVLPVVCGITAERLEIQGALPWSERPHARTSGLADAGCRG